MLRCGVAEFVGTFTLIFIGGGAGIISGQDIVAVALANGLAIGIMVTNLGHISGGHFNPAITAGFLATRRIKARARGLLLGVRSSSARSWPRSSCAGCSRSLRSSEPSRAWRTASPTARALVLELIMTFFLVWAVFATAVDERGAFKAIAGLAIGLTITIDVFVGGPITGAAMNPARAFGPELASGSWSNWWIYWIGPILGALIAALGYEYLYLRKPEPDAGSGRSPARPPPR